MASSKSTDISVVGQVTEITGNVSGRGALRIEGKVSGSVTVTGALEITADGRVTGDVSGESLTLGGSLSGDVDVRGPVVIGPQAAYQGTLRAGRVSLAAGASFSGRIENDFELELSI
jgi:cytoskeletal protein CcmA (bactofilin family)